MKKFIFILVLVGMIVTGYAVPRNIIRQKVQIEAVANTTDALNYKIITQYTTKFCKENDISLDYHALTIEEAKKMGSIAPFLKSTCYGYKEPDEPVYYVFTYLPKWAVGYNIVLIQIYHNKASQADGDRRCFVVER